MEEKRVRSASASFESLSLGVRRSASTDSASSVSSTSSSSSVTTTPISTPTRVLGKKISKMPSSADMTHLLSTQSTVTVTPTKSHKEFLSQNTQFIANALTLHDFSLFSKIAAHEILMKSGWTLSRVTVVPSLDAMSKRFNDVSLWVATEILGRANDRAHQAGVIEKFIDIAEVPYLFQSTKL